MAKTAFAQWDTTAANNTDINSINIAEGMSPAGVNNALREMMRQLIIAVPDKAVTDTISGAWTYTANATWNDSVKALFGTGADLEIYHDGTDAQIVNGTGAVKVTVPDTKSISAFNASGETLFSAFSNGGILLYHNNVIQIQTFVAGPTLTGNVTVTGTIALADDVYDSSWNALLEAPTKNAVYDKIETLDLTTTGTALTTTSGTTQDFTGIPSTVTKIEVMLSGVSLDGTEELLLQIGDSGGFETTGYVSASGMDGSYTDSTAGFQVMHASSATMVVSGIITLLNITGDTWVVSGVLDPGASERPRFLAGTKALSGTLTQIRLTSTGTPDDFDAGTFNIRYS